ncbi:MAG TPA: class I SAM-dependent methyltransferase [Candidatus Thermoplasmatota archaeon]|nr:class I SAM-dependent methyltransferase [Candidatus Thermoplasmatota archaeon]
MTMKDPFVEFKAKQREGWKNYGPAESHTTRTAAHLVRVADVKRGQRVLDVACGTGPVAVTAARLGAIVSGVDLTPELLMRAAENSAIAAVDVAWREGDVEMLPYRDGEFDVVLSQFGHIFAPRPDVATSEMLRVLKPGGTLAFSAWAPSGAVGAMFGVISKHLPPPPPGVPPPTLWGDVATVRARLGERVRDLYFEHAALEGTALSPAHNRLDLEAILAPLRALFHEHRDDPKRIEAVRAELDAALAPYHRDNVVRNEYLLVRALKA